MMGTRKLFRWQVIAAMNGVECRGRRRIWVLCNPERNSNAKDINRGDDCENGEEMRREMKRCLRPMSLDTSRTTAFLIYPILN